jgi:hypothetical protein
VPHIGAAFRSTLVSLLIDFKVCARKEIDAVAGGEPATARSSTECYSETLIHSLSGISPQLIAHERIRIRPDVGSALVVHVIARPERATRALGFDNRSGSHCFDNRSGSHSNRGRTHTDRMCATDFAWSAKGLALLTRLPAARH